MKTILFVAAILSVTALAPRMSLAHGHGHESEEDGANIALVSQATTAALGTFEESASRDQKAKFLGVKAWLSGHGIKAKIYLNDQTTVKYNCHQHEEDAPFECHAAE